MVVVDVVGVNPKGQISSGLPVIRETFANSGSFPSRLPVKLIIGKSECQVRII